MRTIDKTAHELIPKTADGVPVYPRMTIFTLANGVIVRGNVQSMNQSGVRFMCSSEFGPVEKFAYYFDIYSTYEADEAEKANKHD